MKVTTIHFHRTLIASVMVVVALASCSPVISYRRQVVGIPAEARGIPSHSETVGRLKQAERSPDPMAAAAGFFDAARSSHAAALAGEKSALVLYNHAVARLIETLEAEQLMPWEGAVDIGDGDGRRLLRARMAPGVPITACRLVVVDSLIFHGRYAGTQATRDGIGAPVVAVIKSHAEHRKNFLAQESYVALTAVLKFEGADAARLEFFDPLERVVVSGSNQDLAANFTAPVALALAETRIDRLGLVRLFNVRRFSHDASVIRLQNYDPERIPVLMVHGLQDTPATWMPMYKELLSDPEIRDRYQFWVFSYPSGLPYPHSAALLRREMDGVRMTFPDHKNLVLVGHSMGGIISRLLVTDAGDTIWREMFGQGPDEMRIEGRSRELLLDALVFDRRADVDRAIFIATPHRGSMLASNWIGRTVSRMVRLPSYLTDVRNDVLSVLSVDAAGLELNLTPNSIDTLAPNNRFVRQVNNIPVHPSVPFHSIIGDRGRGNTPDSSDGVVAYWSSHMEGAASERIVPSDHSAHQHPDAIQEVKRILNVHLNERR